MKSFIEVNYSNSMWNNGRVSVFIDGKTVDSVFLEDDERDEDDVIASFVIKYGIKNVSYVQDKFIK